MTHTYKIVVLPGDGVGREVVPETVKVLKAARDTVTGFDFDFVAESTIWKVERSGPMRLGKHAKNRMQFFSEPSGILVQ